MKRKHFSCRFGICIIILGTSQILAARWVVGDGVLALPLSMGLSKPSDTIDPQPRLPESVETIAFSGYLETYYSFDFSRPANHLRQPFLYSYNRHNEFNLNIGFIKWAYSQERIRAHLALMAGTYSNDNLASEQGVLKNVLEANAGISLSRHQNLWLDAGIFSSHIGFESAIGKDCWTLTRSLVAENSPYYESGIKLSYTSDDGKWFVSALLLNGWQRIARPDGNQTPALGHQLTYRPNAHITINSSSFIGNDKPDSIRQMRYYHNLYAQIQLHQRLALTLGFDIGVQQKSKNSRSYDSWYTPVAILKTSLSEKYRLAVRAEYFSDPGGVIIATGNSHPFQTFGYSVNLDYHVTPRAWWRVEGRGFRSRDKLFNTMKTASNQNFFLTSSLCLAF
jgi:hypothetical protein